jgi:hypothetical protein
MATPAEIIEGLERRIRICEDEIRTCRDLLQQCREIYPGQFLAQQRFVEANAEMLKQIESPG